MAKRIRGTKATANPSIVMNRTPVQIDITGKVIGPPRLHKILERYTQVTLEALDLFHDRRGMIYSPPTLFGESWSDTALHPSKRHIQTTIEFALGFLMQVFYIEESSITVCALWD
jgi:hypothetical protein